VSTDAAAVAFASAGVQRKGDENEWADTPRNVMVRRFTAYPEGDKRDAEAYKGAIEKLPKGSIVISQSCLFRGSLDRLANANPPPTCHPISPLTARTPTSFSDFRFLHRAVFTPDSTHYPIAKYALERDHHVMVTKPATQLLEHHQELSKLAAERGLVCWVEQCVVQFALGEATSEADET
jgi:hypothetical protein